MTTYFLDRFSEELKVNLQKLLKTPHNFEVIPAHPKTGAHIAVPLFSVAKELSLNPNELAQKLSQEVNISEIKKLEPAGGFLNIWLDPRLLAENLSLDLKENQLYGSNDSGSGELAIVDYVGLNMAKPFSIGHLRPTLQGQAIINLLKLSGYQTVGDTHIGDSGTPFGIWVVGFKLLSCDEKLKEGGAYELGRVYAETKALLKKEEEAGNTKLKEQVAGWLKKLEAGDPEALMYQAKFNDVTIAHMFGVLEELGVHPDENLGESFFLKRGKQIVQELIKDGVATKQSDGSVIVNLEEYDIKTPILIEKSDGTSLYATTDIATIEHRLKNYPKTPKKIIYSVDIQQRFHFQQVFALAKKLGWLESTELFHAWFGQIQETNEDGKREKMSSRKGAMHIRDLIDRALEYATKTVEDRDLKFEDIHKIALGAIKFNDFAQDRKTNILFDWDRMFSLQGFSGPFVQYAGVRIKSILQKLAEDADNQKELKSDYNFEEESELLLKLSKYPELVRTSAEKYEPHHLATYAFELAKELNRYYEEVNIMNSAPEEKEARVWLLKFTYSILESSLGILGIEIPSKM
ncbi:MAG: arginine--tRNA ligase [Candidatus Nomurabacteria bacterium]|nr:MAG: arginine--tRNA ligase [Candidatus Nomurabacteria bacterium]HRV75872.1 arginine--tRNA ligase [Candidatus Saccharimonadales bacterium]